MIALIFQIIEIGNLVTVFMALRLHSRRTCLIVYVNIMETGEFKRLAIIAGHHLVAPRNKAKVEKRSTHLPVFINLIKGAKVHAYTKTSDTCSMHIYIFDTRITGTSTLILFGF